MKKSVVTWGVAVQIIRRHNAMVFRLYTSVLALVFAWLCVWLRWQHVGVLPWQSYHPGQYHGFWQALAMMRGSLLASYLWQCLQAYRDYVLFAMLLLYIPVNFYCVKAIFDSKFNKFKILLHIF